MRIVLNSEVIAGNAYLVKILVFRAACIVRRICCRVRWNGEKAAFFLSTQGCFKAIERRRLTEKK